MDDFASAAMLRLIHLGLARQGLPLPAGAMPPGRGAHVPLDHKRQLLDKLLTRHGPLALLRIGAAVADAPDEPALAALALATSPPDLLARWQRLERYVHARHRVLAQADGASGLRLHHVSLAAHQPPTPAEDLLVLGLLVALASHIGTPGLQATAGQPVQWCWQDGDWRPADRLAPPPLPDEAPSGALGHWHWCWLPVVQAASPHVPPVADCAGAASRQLAADPGRCWTVVALAQVMGTSTRSLQRQLALQGQRFSHLLMDVRLAQSARLLATTPQQTAAIGYHCGFADQSHFSRAFKQHSAMTPVQYRSAFRAAQV